MGKLTSILKFPFLSVVDLSPFTAVGYIVVFSLLVLSIFFTFCKKGCGVNAKSFGLKVKPSVAAWLRSSRGDSSFGGGSIVGWTPGVIFAPSIGSPLNWSIILPFIS